MGLGVGSSRPEIPPRLVISANIFGYSLGTVWVGTAWRASLDAVDKGRSLELLASQPIHLSLPPATDSRGSWCTTRTRACTTPSTRLARHSTTSPPRTRPRVRRSPQWPTRHRARSPLLLCLVRSGRRGRPPRRHLGRHLTSMSSVSGHRKLTVSITLQKTTYVPRETFSIDGRPSVRPLRQLPQRFADL